LTLQYTLCEPPVDRLQIGGFGERATRSQWIPFLSKLDSSDEDIALVEEELAFLDEQAGSVCPDWEPTLSLED
jgi:hypothetical protein